MTLRTCEDVAEDLKVSERTLRTLIRKHRPPVIAAGRQILFDDLAFSRLCEAMRCPSVSSSGQGARTGKSPAPSTDGEFEKALTLLTNVLPKKNVRPGRRSSTEKPSTGRRRLAAVLPPS
jgi:hypothetical protein